MANILYFHDGTQEIICDEFDFAKMLYEKLGIDSEQCFLGYIENMKYEINELEEELKQTKNSDYIENVFDRLSNRKYNPRELPELFN